MHPPRSRTGACKQSRSRHEYPDPHGPSRNCGRNRQLY